LECGSSFLSLGSFEFLHTSCALSCLDITAGAMHRELAGSVRRRLGEISSAARVNLHSFVIPATREPPFLQRATSSLTCCPSMRSFIEECFQRPSPKSFSDSGHSSQAREILLRRDQMRKLPLLFPLPQTFRHRATHAKPSPCLVGLNPGTQGSAS